MGTEPKDKYEYIKILWGIIRRHPDYINYCNGKKFDESGWLVSSEEKTEGAGKIKQRFKIIRVLHPETDAGDWHLTNLFESATRAAVRVTDGVDDLPETHIRVDIDSRAPISEIKADIQHWLKLRGLTRKYIRVSRARRRNEPLAVDAPYPFKKFNPESDAVAFKVWDLLQQDLRPGQIAGILWPDECVQSEVDQDLNYQLLVSRYRSEGAEDYDKKAYQEAYEATGKTSQRNKLFQRVAKGRNRMIEMFQYYQGDEI
jgi:hypothetical protein